MGGSWESHLTFHIQMPCKKVSKKDTPLKFNIAPEEWWLEDDFPFGIAYFLGANC